MQATFERLGVVGYVFMCETSCESQPIIVFRAEDEGDALTASRSIERRSKAQLGPLMLDPVGSNPGKIRSIRLWPKPLQCGERMTDEPPPADDKPKRNRSGPNRPMTAGRASTRCTMIRCSPNCWKCTASLGSISIRMPGSNVHEIGLRWGNEHE